MSDRRRAADRIRSAAPAGRVLPGEETIVRVEDLAFGGRGVARRDGLVLFVDGALAGETARVRVTRLRKGYAEADCVEVLSASPERTAPACRHYGVCGGCDLQHLSAAGQRRAKTGQIRELLRRVARLEAPVVAEGEAMGDPLGYRFRIDFDWGMGPDGAPVLGLHRRGDPGRIEPVDGCLLVPDAVLRLRSLLEDGARSRGLSAWDARHRRGLLRRAEIQAARTTREILLTLETGRGEERAVQAWAADATRRTNRLVGIVRRELDRDGRVAAESLLHGRYHLFEEVDGDRFRIPSGAFFQPNASAWVGLRRAVIDAVDPRREDVLLELHCGVGFFTLPLARRAGSVTAVEGAASAIAAARDNAARAGLGNVRFVAGETGRVVPGLLASGDCAAVVVDPPRGGLDPATARAIAGSGADRIVYVSCDPATLARDLRVFTMTGAWRVTSVTPLDQFPQTHHVESVTRLDRVRGS